MFLPPALATLARGGLRKSLLAGIGAMLRNWKAFLVFGIAVSVLTLCLLAATLLLALGVRIVSTSPTGILRVVCNHTFMIIGTAFDMFGTGFFTLMSYTATRDIFYEEG